MGERKAPTPPPNPATKPAPPPAPPAKRLPIMAGDWVKDDTTRISEVLRTRRRDPDGLGQVVQTVDEDWLTKDAIQEVRRRAPIIGRLEHVRTVECQLEGCQLEGIVQLDQAPGVIQVANSLAQEMMLRNAVALLQRIVDARVLAHGGPDGLELDARRIVRWYADLPADQRDMTLHVGVDWASGPDRVVAVPVSDTGMTRAELIAALAECYRLTGADPDGNEDWRLAEDAVKEVRRLRHEVERLEAAPNGQAYLVDLKRQAEGQR